MTAKSYPDVHSCTLVYNSQNRFQCTVFLVHCVHLSIILLSFSNCLLCPSTPPLGFLMLWSLLHPLFRHCDTPTRTIRHCNVSTHKCLHIVAVQPHRGQTVRPPRNWSVQPFKSGSKRSLWQSDPWPIRPILCSAWGRGQCEPWHTVGAHNPKTHGQIYLRGITGLRSF